MNAEPWTWPDSLDALAAAPESHRRLFENDAVRVLETRIAPGETTEVHTHRWPGILYILSFGDFVRRDGDGLVLVDTRKGGEPPQPGPRSGAALYLRTPLRTSTRPRFT